MSKGTILLTVENVADWLSYAEMLNDGRVVADADGRLRYPHGAPVGKMIAVGKFPDGSPRYRESAEEWFDPGSKQASEFIWPTHQQ